jgi:hypothetical protein
MCDRAHVGLRSTALRAIERTHVIGSILILSINRTSFILHKPTFGGDLRGKKPPCSLL